jgi:hypothetical protein
LGDQHEGTRAVSSCVLTQVLSGWAPEIPRRCSPTFGIIGGAIESACDSSKASIAPADGFCALDDNRIWAGVRCRKCSDAKGECECMKTTFFFHKIPLKG